MKKTSQTYKSLCAEFYELDKPFAEEEAIKYYLGKAFEVKGKILEPMCGTGRFLIPFLEKGYEIVGFDSSFYMLEICRLKCKKKQLQANLVQASFEDFKSDSRFQLAFIPSSSFCLLIEPFQAKLALKVVFDNLVEGGIFLFEIDTREAFHHLQGVWQGRWIKKPEGALIVGNFVSHFHEESGIETTLCRYELWQNNLITHVEVEEFCLRLYKLEEIEDLLEEVGFEIQKKSIPYSEQKIDKKCSTVLYECRKPKT